MTEFKHYEDLAALVARLFMAILFILYGYFKLTGYAGTVAYMGRQGLPAPALFAALAVIIELGGGVLVLVGYQARLVALGCAVYVLIAALIAHVTLATPTRCRTSGKTSRLSEGSSLMVAGPGPYSVDARQT